MSVYRIDEPALGDVTGRGDPKQLAVPAVRFDFKYPDGPRDAEAMFVERVGDEEWVYIIDKNWKLSGESRPHRGSVSGSTVEPTCGIGVARGRSRSRRARS